ncbi:MAG: hypothetical protein ACFFFT_06895 [Candidatus Thorarchaeota archaeon]
MILHEKTERNKLLRLSIVFVILILISVNLSAFKSQPFGKQQTHINIRSATVNTKLQLFLNGEPKNDSEMISVDFDDMINITVFYRDNETETHIPNATVELMGWGNLNETNNQYYNITINAMDLILGINYLAISAEKENYQPQIIQFFIEVALIVGIICRADGGDLLEIDAGDDVVLNIILKDPSNNTIKGAIVTYTWVYGLGELYDPDNDGIYNGTLNVPDVPEGNYKIKIIAFLEDYSFEPYELIMIVNTISKPEITIISPQNGTIFTGPPSFRINFSANSFDKLWVTLNYSNIEYGFIANPGNNILIDMPFSIWKLLPEGHFLVKIYVNDTAGNFDYDEVTFIKEIPPESLPEIGGVNLFILIVCILGILGLSAIKIKKNLNLQNGQYLALS